MPRYLILRHETPKGADRGLHWDFMLETKGVLRTWALEKEPRAEAAIDAIELEDHRIAYLEYEGDISGGRGRVTQWDSGEYKPREQSDIRIVVDLEGSRLRGRISAIREADRPRWRFTIGGTGSSDSAVVL